jgi:predicted Zn finger-like uncharacterized protein
MQRGDDRDMKIECPSCHLTGKVNELELPADGRELKCPRCKKGFHVRKPPPPAGNQDLMNICPTCQYSTFTEEMFAVCPKCGLVVSSYREKLRKQQEMDQLQRDREALTRSHRNPDLILAVPEEGAAVKPSIPQPILVTGWICIAVGGALLLYGLAGVMNYYGKDWQSTLSDSVVEPVSKTTLFFRFGFIPWLITLYSASFTAVAGMFLARKKGMRRELIKAAWFGVALGIIHEVADFINWVRISSSTPSFSYLFTGIVNALLWIILWSAPALALIWFLSSDRIAEEEVEEDNSPVKAS